MNENSVSNISDFVHEQQGRAVRKGLVGAVVGFGLAQAHESNPVAFWRVARWLYVVCAIAWTFGAFSSDLDTSSRVFQGVLAVIGVPVLLYEIGMSRLQAQRRAAAAQPVEPDTEQPTPPPSRVTPVADEQYDEHGTCRKCGKPVDPLMRATHPRVCKAARGTSRTATAPATRTGLPDQAAPPAPSAPARLHPDMDEFNG